ncbi:VanZ family protein [Desulfatibacillum alkenivorans]|uniref:VanZ family protein n=1 Tax=Desulfatibacillum alkenivorans TaxID=259354 RepID=UPI00111498F5
MAKIDPFNHLLMNLAHVPAFAFLSWAWLNFFNMYSFSKKNIITFCFLLVGLILFALGDEYHQSLIPGRTASLSDIGMDVTGICLGVCFFYSGNLIKTKNE